MISAILERISTTSPSSAGRGSGVLQRRIEPGAVLLGLAVIGLAVQWVSLLPCEPGDLCYLMSLEDGRSVAQEWVHPIHVPVLRAYQALLSLFGWHGKMLVPIEIFNICTSLSTLILLYLFIRRLTTDSIANAASLIILASNRDFAVSATRPTPYASAFLCVVISLMLLVSEKPVSRIRYAWSGVFAGLAMGFHASAMALAPAALMCAVFEPGTVSLRFALDKVKAFAATMFVTATACWVTFLSYNSFDLSYFQTMRFHTLFAGIEQLPGTSIYTSGGLLQQISTFFDRLQGERVLIVLTAAFAFATRQRRVSQNAPTPRPSIDGRLTIALFASFLSISAFFLINNARNTFVYSCIALFPAVLAERAGRSRRGSTVLVLLMLPIAAGGILDSARSTICYQHDAFFNEVRFLNERFGPRDILLAPSCAFFETRYLSHLNLFRVQLAAADDDPGCDLPSAGIGPVLRARIESWRSQGSRVILAVGDANDDFVVRNAIGDQFHGLFRKPEVPEGGPSYLEAIRTALLQQGLSLGPPIVSNQGARYLEVLAPDPLGQPPPVPAPSAITLTDLRSEATRMSNVDLAVRTTLLASLHAIVPSDPWNACDLAQLSCKAHPEMPAVCLCKSGCECLSPPNPQPVQQPVGNDLHQPAASNSSR